MIGSSEILYHGTLTPGIKKFEPRRRFVPGGIENIPARIYATDDPAFAAMHSFPWSSDEGIDIIEYDGKLVLQVPKIFKERLNTPVYIYQLPADTFILTEEEETGNTYHSDVAVAPKDVSAFSSVIEAVEHYGCSVAFA